MRHRTELQQLTIDGNYEVVAVRDLSPTWGGARQGAGRKQSAVPSVTVSVRITADTRERIETIAEARGWTVTRYLRQMIEREVVLDSDTL